MKKASAFLFSVVAAFSLGAAQIDSVVIEQQWPWSTDIKVKYVLSEVSEPVDIELRLYDGANEIDVAKVRKAAKGELFGVSANDEHVIRIDPKALFGAGTAAVGDFRADLTLSASPANINEVIYKVYDLDDGGCTDITRADILGNNYGSYETDFGRFGEGFSTSLKDVLIWTGVTNDERYATSKLVLRKVPAAAAGAWTMGGADCPNDAPGHQVTLTKDFWIGVFEVTQAQFARIVGTTRNSFFTTEWPSFFSLASDRDTRPVEKVGYNMIRGLLATADWPVSAAIENGSFLSLLRGRLAGSPLVDLPTEAQWEFACKAGTTTHLNSGMEPLHMDWTGDANLALLGRSKIPGGMGPSGTTAATADTPADAGGTAKVGSYLPNALGLYDMHGNVFEWCLDFYEAYAADAQTNPPGPERHNNNWSRSLRGGAWNQECKYCLSTARFNATYNTVSNTCGFRLCLTEE